MLTSAIISGEYLQQIYAIFIRVTSPHYTNNAGLNPVLNFILWVAKRSLPGRDFDPEIAVNCNSQEGQDRTLRQDQHRARHKQAAVKVSLESDVDSNGQRDDECSHCNIRQSQGDNKTKRGISQRFINLHRPDHHHIPDYRRHSNYHLHSDVD